jgi:SnoaL-like domain
MNTSSELSNVSTDQAEEVVLRLSKALNDGDFETARRFVHDELKCVGPFGSRDGAEAYLHEIERFRLKFDIKKISADGNDVCALYSVIVPGMSCFSVAIGCASFQIEAGKVSSLRFHLHRQQ